MRYKYIGTEEQLVERGFEMEHKYFGNHPRPLIHGLRKEEKDEVYVLLQRSYIDDDYDIGLLKWNSPKNYTDITPYIQDLIDDGLVEVIS